VAEERKRPLVAHRRRTNHPDTAKCIIQPRDDARIPRHGGVSLRSSPRLGMKVGRRRLAALVTPARDDGERMRLAALVTPARDDGERMRLAALVAPARDDGWEEASRCARRPGSG